MRKLGGTCPSLVQLTYLHIWCAAFNQLGGPQVHNEARLQELILHDSLAK